MKGERPPVPQCGHYVPDDLTVSGILAETFAYGSGIVAAVLCTAWLVQFVVQAVRLRSYRRKLLGRKGSEVGR